MEYEELIECVFKQEQNIKAIDGHCKLLLRCCLLLAWSAKWLSSVRFISVGFNAARELYFATHPTFLAQALPFEARRGKTTTWFLGQIKSNIAKFEELHTMDLNISWSCKVRSAFLCDYVQLWSSEVCHFFILFQLLSTRVCRSRCEQLLHFFVAFAWRDGPRGTVSKHRGILASSHTHWESWDVVFVFSVNPRVSTPAVWAHTWLIWWLIAYFGTQTPVDSQKVQLRAYFFVETLAGCFGGRRQIMGKGSHISRDEMSS